MWLSNARCGRGLRYFVRFRAESHQFYPNSCLPLPIHIIEADFPNLYDRCKSVTLITSHHFLLVDRVGFFKSSSKAGLSKTCQLRGATCVRTNPTHPRLLTATSQDPILPAQATRKTALPILAQRRLDPSQSRKRVSRVWERR